MIHFFEARIHFFENLIVVFILFLPFRVRFKNPAFLIGLAERIVFIFVKAQTDAGQENERLGTARRRSAIRRTIPAMDDLTGRTIGRYFVEGLYRRFGIDALNNLRALASRGAAPTVVVTDATTQVAASTRCGNSPKARERRFAQATPVFPH